MKTSFFRLVWLIAAALLTTACAGVDMKRSIADTNRIAVDFTHGKLALAGSEAQRAAMRAAATELLEQPLDEAAAVQLALLQSAPLQERLAQAWMEQAQAAQSGRIANPLLLFERTRFRSELELDRLLSIGLLDLLTLPQRQRVASRRIQQARLQLTVDAVHFLTEVRGAWIAAVAAQQRLQYAGQVGESAAASAELARRMLQAGNFSPLASARQQTFQAEATALRSAAALADGSARERLIRVLSLSPSQAAALHLPQHLPDLPADPRTADDVNRTAVESRLDVRVADLQFDAATRAQGLTRLTSLIDIQAGARRDTVFDDAAGVSDSRRGIALDVQVPLFDDGGLQREAMNAQTLAAAARLEATLSAAHSLLRESYTAYQIRYQSAKYFRDEVLPLRKQIADENVLRYNGMLIGIFDLLADAREQSRSVMAAIDAQEQFWWADARLRATIMGANAQ